MVLGNFEKNKKELSRRDSYPIKKIGLMGCWGFGSMGNLAHQVAMIQNIQKYQPDAQIYCFSVYPKVTQAIHGIPSFTFYRRSDNEWWKGDRENFLTTGLNNISNKIRKISNPFIRKLFIPVRVPVEFLLESFALARSVRSLKGFDMLIITGGGHFDDVYNGAWELPYALFRWSLIARLDKVKFLVVSNGAGPITNSLSKFFFKQALSFAIYRSYRDDFSKEYLKKVVDFHRIEDPVYPDLAHSLELTRYQINRQSKKELKTIVGIAPIPHRFAGTLPGFPGGYTPTYLNYLNKLASFVSWLLENQYIVSFFVFDESVDREAVRDLKQVLIENKVSYSEGQIIEQSAPIYNRSTFDDFMNKLAAADLFVTSRFHGVLLPQLLNKPTLALSFADKTDCLMTDVGQAEYCLSIDQFEVEILKKKFIALETNQTIIKEQLAKRTQQYQEMLDEQYARLFGKC